jgi:hypothetical protein
MGITKVRAKFQNSEEALLGSGKLANTHNVTLAWALWTTLAALGLGIMTLYACTATQTTPGSMSSATTTVWAAIEHHEIPVLSTNLVQKWIRGVK